MPRSLRKLRKFWKARLKNKRKKYPTVLAIHLEPGNRIVLPDGKTEARVQYVEESKANFLVSKASGSLVCVTYLKWDAINRKQIVNQKLFVPWNEEIQVVKEDKARWPTVYGFLSKLAKKLEVKRDW